MNCIIIRIYIFHSKLKCKDSKNEKKMKFTLEVWENTNCKAKKSPSNILEKNLSWKFKGEYNKYLSIMNRTTFDKIQMIDKMLGIKCSV